MNKKQISPWVAISTVVILVVVVLGIGYRAINPPVPAVTVTNMSHGYSATPPPGYTGGYAKAQ